MTPVDALYFAATLGLGLGFGLYLTPLVRRGAVRFGVLDAPDGGLKAHRAPTPYLGGIAVYVAFLLTLSLVFDFKTELLGLLLGGTMVAMLGLFDDLRVLPASLKLLGQLLTVAVMLKSGIAIELVALPPWLNVPLTVLWLVGVTNALNIIDVSDGLAGGVACTAGLSMAGVAFLSGDLLIATTTLALIGAILGFLRYNWTPAQIYLGDTGSLFIGFMLAALAMIGRYTQTSPWGALAPLFFLAVPLLDTTLVVIVRLSRGRSPFQGSPDHLAHRLRWQGWSTEGIARAGVALGALGGLLGIGLVLAPPWVGFGLAASGAAVYIGILVKLLVAEKPATGLDEQPATHTEAQGVTGLLAAPELRRVTRS